MRYRGAEMSALRPWMTPHALLLSLAAACGSPPATSEGGSDTGSDTGDTGNTGTTGDTGTTTAEPTTGVTGVITAGTGTDTEAEPTTGDPTGGTGPEPPDLQCPGDPSGQCDMTNVANAHHAVLARHDRRNSAPQPIATYFTIGLMPPAGAIPIPGGPPGGPPIGGPPIG